MNGRRWGRAQRGDRRRLGDRQGDPGSLHAPGRALYPEWGFEGNVGYSTPEHREAIMRHGICPLHRRSFASVAYSQLGLDSAAGEFEEIPGSEGGADVIDIREAMRAEADADDVEAVAGDA